MNGVIHSGELKLARYLATPHGAGPGLPGLVFCHGFPTGPLDARQSAGTFPELMDRIANEMGWAALTFTFRGCGTSEGDFSLLGWMHDLNAAIAHLRETCQPSSVFLAGTSTGGSLALCAAADDPDIAGVACLGARADFDDWANHPRRFVDHAREIGAIRTPGFPPSFDAWTKELSMFRPLEAVRRFAPRPLLVLHGGDDDQVPAVDARRIVGAHGSAELRVIAGAGHRLRHDPRAIAILLGWLDRHR